jgi:hypothetical protein
MEIAWSKRNLHEVVKAEVGWTVGSRWTRDRDLCVSAEHISGEDKGGGHKTVEAQSYEEGWPKVIARGHMRRRA